MGKLIATAAGTWLGPTIISFVCVLVAAGLFAKRGMATGESIVFALWVLELALFGFGSYLFWRVVKPAFPSLGPRLIAFGVHLAVQAGTFSILAMATALAFNG